MPESHFQLREAETGRIIAARLEVAKSLWRQTVGLLDRRALAPDGGLWLEPCNSIHTIGMRFAIDVLFLDCTGRLLRALPNVRPWRICWPVLRARVVVELPAGSIAQRNIQLGNRYQLTGG